MEISPSMGKRIDIIVPDTNKIIIAKGYKCISSSGKIERRRDMSNRKLRIPQSTLHSDGTHILLYFQGSLCNDFCVVNFCGTCVLCQLSRELNHIGLRQ